MSGSLPKQQHQKICFNLCSHKDQSPLVNKTNRIDIFIRPTHAELMFKLIGAMHTSPCGAIQTCTPRAYDKLKPGVTACNYCA